SGPRLEFAIHRRVQIEVTRVRRAVAIRWTVKTISAGGKHSLNTRRDLASLRGNALHSVLDAERIPELERTECVGVAPAHGAIDFDDAIADLGHHGRRVEAHIAEQLPEEGAGAVAR